MIRRALTGALRRAASGFRVVSVTGPRQSGKTTLVRQVFPRHAYVSLEVPDDRRQALEDPRGFLDRFPGPVILDEAQRAPDLFSYIQTIVDEHPRPGRFVLTGSSNFLLMRTITQSLAGRCAVLHLHPFSRAELEGRAALDALALGRSPVRGVRKPRAVLDEVLFRGGYPSVQGRGIEPRRWFQSYVETYVERDVRQLLRVGDLETFERFLRVGAARSGQLLNLSSLAADVGITHPTARAWISILQTSFLVLLMRPYFRNVGKRMTKSPKLYWLDSGLLCYLLGIRSPAELSAHPLRGAVFESFVVSELVKSFTHRGEIPPLSFWRDRTGKEIDVLVESAREPVTMEIKAGKTVAGDALANLHHWQTMRGGSAGPAALIYGGDRTSVHLGVLLLPWWRI